MVVWGDNHSNDSVINPLQCILLHIFTVHGAGFFVHNSHCATSQYLFGAIVSYQYSHTCITHVLKQHSTRSTQYSFS